MELWNLASFALGEVDIFYNSYRPMKTRDALVIRRSTVTPFVKNITRY